MIAASRDIAWPAVVVAGALSLAAHGAVLTGLVAPAEGTLIEGGAGAEVAALGSDFRDYTRGALPSQAAEAVASPVSPAESPAQPQPATPTETAAAEAPPGPARAEATTPAQATAATARPALAPQPPQTPATETAALTPQPPAATTPAALVVQSAPTPPASAAPSAPPLTAPLPEVTVAEARPDTPRPRQRPAPPERRPARQASAAQAAGDSDRDARRGTAEGQEPASAASAAQRQAAAPAPGNAAASTYPGQVMQRIQRTRRARVSARGTAVVAFTIAPGGGLAGVQIARASGSAALDQAALDHIRRAAPFPAPPDGARRQFSFEFVGR